MKKFVLIVIVIFFCSCFDQIPQDKLECYEECCTRISSTSSGFGVIYDCSLPSVNRFCRKKCGIEK